MNWEYAKVFISSSFIDMHAERDYLVKDVFPELEEWCEAHKIHLTNIDLRWGVSEDTSRNNNTIEKCLTNIDGSRPFFLCFLGQRRGWIPDYDNTLSQSVDWSNVNKLSFEYRLNSSVSEGTLSVLIGDEEIFKQNVTSNEWNEFNYDVSSFNENADLKFTVESGAFNLKSISNPIENGDFLRNTDSWSFTGDVKVVKDDFYSPYVLLNGSHISQETRERYHDIAEYEKKSATEMEIEHALLSPLYDFIDKKKNNIQTKHSLFFIRDESSIKDIKDPHKRIYTNYSLISKDEFKNGKILELSRKSKNIIAEQDEASKEIINKIKDKKIEENNKNKTRKDKDKVYVKITEYTGEWNEKSEIPVIKALGYYNDKGERIPRYKDNEWVGRLTNFKADGKALKEVIIKQLKKELIKEFPQNFINKYLTRKKDVIKTKEDVIKYVDEIVDDHIINSSFDEKESILQSEINQQDIFCHLNTEGYINRKEYEDKLWEYVENKSNDICLVTAKAGLGKTMLLAKFVTDYEEKYKKYNVYKRFCGASNLSSKTLDLWQTIIKQAKIEDETLYPYSIDELKRNLNMILEKISLNGNTLIIIDAVNQMSEGIKMLKWLDYLPDNVKMIVSIKEYEKDEHFNSQLQKIKSMKVYSHFEIKEIDDKSKKELMKKYLEGYLKELDDKQIETICKTEGSKNPLYLKILLAELRVFPSFEQLKDEIERFGDSPLSAFNHLLERLESDEKHMGVVNLVPLIFSLLASSRSGLTKKELIDMIKSETDFDLTDIKEAININFRQVRQFMSRKEGRDDFFFETFKLAAKNRYSKENINENETLKEYFKDKQYSHQTLADYFMKDALIQVPKDISDDDKFYLYDKEVQENYQFKGVKVRSYNELPYHLNESENYQRLVKTLSSYSFIKNKIELSDIYNIINDYQFKDEKHPFLKKEDHPIILIGRALELSAPILKDKENSEQLPAQLWGRMNEIEEDIITSLLEEIKEDNSIQWLKSTNTSLYSPKSSIIKRFKPEGKKSTTALAITKDKKLFIGNEDGTLEYYDIDENDEITLQTPEKEEDKYKIIKITILKNEKTGQEKELLVANSNGTIKKWDIDDKSTTKTWNINEEFTTEITDIYYSNTYQKIYASSHEGIYTINLETDEIKREDIDNKNYNHIFVPRINEAILVCDEREVDGWDVYEMRKAYNQYHQHELTSEELGGNISNIKQTSAEIRFMGLIRRFLILISENGQMKMWNTLKSSGRGESIDEKITTSPHDRFAQAITLEDENQVITMSEMGVLRVYNIPEPKNPTFRFDQYSNKTKEEDKIKGNEKNDENNKNIQTGITDTTAITYYSDEKNKWLIVGNNLNEINIIDLDKQVKETEHTRHIESVLTIKLNGEEMITASDNGEYYKWRINDNKEYVKIDTNDEKNQNRLSNDFRYDCLSYNKTENKLICSGTKLEENGRITIHKATWNTQEEKVTNDEILEEQIIDIAQNKSNIITIDDKNLTIGSNKIPLEKQATTLTTNYETEEVYIGFLDGTIAKYTTQLNYYEQYNNTPVEKIKLTTDKIIVGHEDGKLEIYTNNGEHQSIEAHEKRITNIHVLNDEEIITISKDKTLKIWNINNKENTYVYYLDIYATAINTKEDKIIVGDALGNLRFFKF